MTAACQNGLIWNCTTGLDLDVGCFPETCYLLVDKASPF